MTAPAREEDLATQLYLSLKPARENEEATPMTNSNPEAAELDQTMQRQLDFLHDQLKTTRGNAKRDLSEWIDTLQQARQSLADGALTAEQITALTNQGCELAGAIPANRIDATGEFHTWVTNGSEEMARSIAAVHHLADQLRQHVPEQYSYV